MTDNYEPMLPDHILEALVAQDPDAIDAVVSELHGHVILAANRLTGLIRHHALMHLLGKEHGDPDHDTCMEYLVRQEETLTKARASMWN